MAAGAGVWRPVLGVDGTNMRPSRAHAEFPLSYVSGWMPRCECVNVCVCNAERMGIWVRQDLFFFSFTISRRRQSISEIRRDCTPLVSQEGRKME